MEEDEQVNSEKLTPEQEERLKTIRQVVRVNIDGDWDERMIHAIFDELEKVLGVGEPVREEEEVEENKGTPRPAGRRRGRR